MTGRDEAPHSLLQVGSSATSFADRRPGAAGPLPAPFGRTHIGRTHIGRARIGGAHIAARSVGGSRSQRAGVAAARLGCAGNRFAAASAHTLGGAGLGSPFPALRVIGPRHHASRPPSAHFQDRQERGGDPRSGCLLLAACSRCGPLCLFAPTRQPQAFTVNPCLYLYVTRLAQHLAPLLRLNVMFPFCVGHKEHLRPKRAAFGAMVGV